MPQSKTDNSMCAAITGMLILAEPAKICLLNDSLVMQEASAVTPIRQEVMAPHVTCCMNHSAAKQELGSRTLAGYVFMSDSRDLGDVKGKPARKTTKVAAAGDGWLCMEKHVLAKDATTTISRHS